MFGLLSKIFGTKNERELKRYITVVDRVNELEPQISGLSDDALRAKAADFRSRLQSDAEPDDMRDEVFAVVREIAKRQLNMRHFDVQIIGGTVLHEGRIAEMKTGEGKTLVATLPVCLNALTGRGVHVVTVNDYLAKRDARWMAPIYDFLGLSIGVIQHDASFLYDPAYLASDKRLDSLRPCTRQEAYRADITYGTNNEFGFDYLRDNMKYALADFSQRELNFAIVDEVDSILIDEARTPLIISGPSEDSTDKYYKINRIVPKLKPEEDFKIDEKLKSVVMTEAGSAKAERLIGVANLYDPANIELVHHVLQALRAHHLFKHDVDYVVKDDEIIIVDEFTGRLMPGRRWSDGLHQAIEAKEGVKIENENQTLATITFQNLFRMYNKLAGMTGTADTEAAEFAEIYNLEVVVIPTNRPMVRADQADMVYKAELGKFNAVILEIAECHAKGQPVLVGTTSIEKSEQLGALLKKKGVRHSVLNAKYHEKEAEIIAQAGRFGAVTIATNMAGRGTDIVLGGNPAGLARELLHDPNAYTPEEYADAFDKAKAICQLEREKVLQAGGLHILGTERHEARRIDNQLRGRSGRQGDPGSSRFYLSLEDDLLRIFGSDRINSLMEMLKMEEDVPIENKMVTKAIEGAQKKVEAHNFDIRKHLLKYDDVMNKQRKEIYAYRREVLESESSKERILELSDAISLGMIAHYCPEDVIPEEWDMATLKDTLFGVFGIKIADAEHLNPDELQAAIVNGVRMIYEEKEREAGNELMRYIERMIFLQVIDAQWKDHLLAIDHMKQGIGLRGYAQRDPLVEYKKEAFSLFEEMSDRISSEVISRLLKVQIRHETEEELPRKQEQRISYNRSADGPQQLQERGGKVGRNDPCTCGSGKKYKKCCGK
ncbi:MAG TPA: preprotein translocase subunit SecA [Dissulfurispiraceae bacterium]|nr:preprotein translocase subunit SecA [Dissulfurispiraceae bacterium]